MKQPSQYLWTGGVLAWLAVAAAAQSPVARWNLGEQDPAAAGGNLGNSDTLDAVGHNHLSAFGAPAYSAETPGGGSTLSMSFDGGSCYQGSIEGNGAALDALYRDLNFNHFSLSCDVYMTAPGVAGFSFPVSVGPNTGGVAPVEVGGNWHLIHKGVANSAAGPAVTLNTWTHLDLVRRPFGSSVLSVLYVNGVAAVTNSTVPAPIGDFVTIGANELGSGAPWDLEGYFQGLVDNVVITNLDLGAPPAIAGIAAAPGTLYSGNSLILTAVDPLGDSAGRSFVWRRDGVEVTNSGPVATVTLPRLTAADSGRYDVVLTNLYGATTSSVVSVTVLDPSHSGGADVLRLSLGEADPGAADGRAGNEFTRDSIGGRQLAAFGTPIYRANTSAEDSTLSLAFDGGSYYQTADLAQLYDRLNFGDLSLSCDVYPTALGFDGFSFPMSMGDGAGGLAIAEIGGFWHILHQGQASSLGRSVELNAWTHLELQRREFGDGARSRLFIDGIDTGAEIVSPPSLPIHPILTIGANALADGIGIEGGFSGLIDNVAIHDYSLGVRPSLSSGLAMEPANQMPAGEFCVLAVTAQGASPLAFLWRKDGVVFATETGSSAIPASVTLPGLTADDAGFYDVVVTNLSGSVTSSPVRLTVLQAGDPNPMPHLTFRLGEDDPAASADAPGNATTQPAEGALELTGHGAAAYSAHATPDGGKLALRFDGASFYEGAGAGWTSFYSLLDFNRFSVSCDVRLSAPGEAGFSFPLSVGGSGTGLAVVEIDGQWRLIHHNVGISSGVDAALDAWTHLEVRRMNFGAGVESRLYIDGAYTGVSLASEPVAPTGAFFVGANRVASGPEGFFNGEIDNVRLIGYTAPIGPLSIQASGGSVRVTLSAAGGAVFALWRSLSIQPATWSIVATGPAANGHVDLVDPAPPASGAFYRVTTE